MKHVKGLLAIVLVLCVGFSAGCAAPLKKGASVNKEHNPARSAVLADNIDAELQKEQDKKLDASGSIFDGKRGQTYGSDTPLHNAESGIPNTPIAGNGSIGLSLGGSAVGQSMNIGMNDFWDGKYSTGLGEGEGVLPLTLGSVGYDVLDNTSIAETDIDLAPTAAKATASSDRGADFSPWAAVAGDYVSVAYWGFGWWSNSNGRNSWLQLEFNQPITFQRFALWNISTCRNGAGVDRTTGVSKWNTDTYRIETSDNGSTWTSVYREESNHQPICDRDLAQPQTAKYVRLFIENPGSDGIARVNKFSLFASPKNDLNLMPKLVNGANASIQMSAANFSGDANSAGTDIYGTVMGQTHNLAGWGQRGYGWMFGGANGANHQYVTYNLNAETSFKSYQLFNGSASAAAAYNSSDWLGWQLQTSTTASGEDFTTVHEVFPPTDGNAENAGGQPSVNSFDLTQEATGVKRIRLVCTKAAGGSALLSQFKIFAGTLQESGIQTENRATFHQNIRQGKIGADAVYNGKAYAAETTIGQNGKNYIVTEFTNKGNTDIDFRYFTFAHRYRLPGYTQNAGVSTDGKTIYSTRTTRIQNTLAWVASATIAATIEGGTWKQTDARSVGSAYGDFTVPANETVRIITCIDGRQYNQRNVPSGYSLTETTSDIRANHTPTQALAIADSQNGVGVDILAESDAFWKDFWGKSYADVGDEVVEKYYYNALYISGSASREDNVPASLFGPFTTSDTMAWGGAYTTDYNLYGTYMALAGSNRADLLKPLVRNALESWGGVEELGGGIGKEYAKQINSLSHVGPFKDGNGNFLFANGVDGILSAVVSGPHGYAINKEGFFHVLFTSAYQAVPVLSFYDMTQGEGEIAPGVKLTKQMEYDYLKDLVQLWEQILYYENGIYKVRFDGAWEINPGEDVGTSANAFTLASLHRFTSRLIEDAAALGITVAEEPRLAKWADINANLEPYPVANVVGQDGTMRLSYCDTQESADKNAVSYSSNRNPNVVVAQVFPVGDLGLYSSKEEIQIMRGTVGNIQSWDNMNAMPTIFSVAARLGYSEASIEEDVYFDNLGGPLLPDLFSQYREVVEWGMAKNNICNLYDPLELIDTCGGAQGLNDMLVQSHKGIITLFPAYPTARDAQFANLQVGNGFLVSATYNGTTKQMSDIKIESKHGGNTALAIPKGANWKIVDAKGNDVSVRRTTVAGLLSIDDHNDVSVLSFATQAGVSYYAVPVTA